MVSTVERILYCCYDHFILTIIMSQFYHDYVTIILQCYLFFKHYEDSIQIPSSLSTSLHPSHLIHSSHTFSRTHTHTPFLSLPLTLTLPFPHSLPIPHSLSPQPLSINQGNLIQTEDPRPQIPSTPTLTPTHTVLILIPVLVLVPILEYRGLSSK